MSLSGWVAVAFGVLIIISRGPLLFAPAATLRFFAKAIQTEARTRLIGVFAILLALLMIWSSSSAQSGLEGFLLILGVFILVFTVPGMLMFPRTYMGILNSMLPTDLSGALFGWRLLGLVGVTIGIAFVSAGMHTGSFS